MTKLNKTQGEKGNCPSCKIEMLCVAVKGKPKQDGTNWPDKLQWHVNGKPHYGYDPSAVNDDGTRGAPYCITDAQEIHENTAGLVNNSLLDNSSSKVEWPEFGNLTPEQDSLLGGYDGFVALAVVATKKLHPSMDTNSGVFGQIVSAKIGHLIQMAKITALKRIEKQLTELVEAK